MMTHPGDLRQSLLHYFCEPAEYMLKDGSSRLASPKTDDIMHLFAAEHARLLSDLRREMPKGMLREDYEILVNASINGQRREALVKAYELASKEALAAIDATLDRLKGTSA